MSVCVCVCWGWSRRIFLHCSTDYEYTHSPWAKSSEKTSAFCQNYLTSRLQISPNFGLITWTVQLSKSEWARLVGCDDVAFNRNRHFSSYSVDKFDPLRLFPSGQSVCVCVWQTWCECRFQSYVQIRSSSLQTRESVPPPPPPSPLQCLRFQSLVKFNCSVNAVLVNALPMTFF